MIVRDGTPILKLGDLDLMDTETSGVPFWLEATAEEASFGNPEAITRQVAAFLMDGAISVTDGYNNREMTLRIAVHGEDSYGLALGESALVAEAGKRNVLTWAPPNQLTGYGATCVFDVVNSTLDYALDDLLELNLIRVYTLTIEAQPFARTELPITEVSPSPPPGAPPTTTLVDACSSTTGWTATRLGGSAIPSTSGGAVKASWTNNTGAIQNSAYVTLTRSGLSADMTATPYVRIDWSSSHYASRTGVRTHTVKLNGVTVTEVARDGSVAWYESPSTTLTSVAITAATPLSALSTAKIEVSIADISRTDSTTLSTTTGQRQTFRTLMVKGSVRTQGSLAVESETAALGSTLVYTCPTTATLQQPPLRGLRTDGGSDTADSGLISGKRSDLTVNHVFDIPAANIPDGGYLLVARMRVTSGTSWTLTWAGSSVVGGTVVDSAAMSGTTSGTSSTNAWVTVPVAKIPLPTFKLGPSGLVRLELQGSANTQLDEAWIFNMDLGRLSIVECGTGTPAAGGSSSRLWLDAASVDNPVPSVWMGSAADRSDAHGAGPALASFSAHEFLPPSMNVFVVTSNSVDTTVTLGPYHPRWHTHVVE